MLVFEYVVCVSAYSIDSTAVEYCTVLDLDLVLGAQTHPAGRAPVAREPEPAKTRPVRPARGAGTATVGGKCGLGGCSGAC